jgi:hypothetical protein
MREALDFVLQEDKFPGIDNRLLTDDDWTPSRDALRVSDRKFLRNWIRDNADEKVWGKIIVAARRFQNSNTFDHLNLIWYALRAKRMAEDVRLGDDPLQRERQETHKRRLELAKSAEVLSGFWQEAQAKSAVLWQPFPIPFEQVLQLQHLNEIQAKLLRQLAGTPPPPSTRISRQSRGKKLCRTRECTAFMHSMAGHMLKVSGKPFFGAVTTLTNIAFPGADVSVDAVRFAVTQATTRAGRRRKTDALGGDKSA